MTRPKFIRREELLDWSYSPEELAAIRATVPGDIDDTRFAEIMEWVRFRINVPEASARDFVSGHPLWDEELTQEVGTLDATLKILADYIDSDWSDEEGLRLQGDIGRAAEKALRPLLAVRLEVESLRTRLARDADELRQVVPQSNRRNAFVEGVCRAVDSGWKALGRQPDYGQQYAAFFGAVAKPVLSCPRFREFGAVWTNDLPRTHVSRLKSKKNKREAVQFRGDDGVPQN